MAPLEVAGELRVVDARHHLLQEAADQVGEEVRAVALLGPPERRHRGPGVDRRDEHVVVGDPLDPPALDAEAEAVADRALPHELLVELAEESAAALDAQREVAAVRNRAAGGEDQPLRPGAGADRPVDPVDRHQRTQPAHPGRGEAARQHLDHQVEVSPGQLPVGLGGAHRVVELVELPAPFDGHRQQHLGEHIERVGDRPGGLDVTVEHRPGQHRGHDEGMAVERVDPSPAGLSDAVAGASEALQGGGHGRRRLDQHHLVDAADVDAELERVGRHDGAQRARLEPVLDHRADLARQRAVVGVGELVGLGLVEEAGDLLDDPLAVAEDQRRAVAAHHPLELRGELGPQGLGVTAGAGLGDRKRDLELEALGGGGGDGLHPAWPEHRAVGGLLHDRPADPARDLVEGLDRRRQRDPLELARQRRQPLDRGHQVHAALAVDHRVDLVEDHRAQPAQHRTAARRGEQDVEALRGGDQDLGRALRDRPPLRLRGVAGPREDADGGRDQARGGPLPAQPGERLEQVAADVVAERAQRGDVENADLAARPGLAEQPVDRPQEGGEGLAAAGGSGDQHVLAGGDDRPGQVLDLGRLADPSGEPRPGRRAEQLEGVGRGSHEEGR